MKRKKASGFSFGQQAYFKCLDYDRNNYVAAPN